MRREALQKIDEKMKETVANYPLFEDIDDKEIQANNRGAIVANIFQDFSGGKGVTSRRGLTTALNYLSSVSEIEERKLAVEFVDAHLVARGMTK